MRATVSVDRLKIDKALYDFVNHEAIAGTGLQAQQFWSGFSALVRALSPRNHALLRRRDELQAKIDAWHRQNPGPGFDRSKYQAFLRDIGYLVPERRVSRSAHRMSIRRLPISQDRSWWCRSAMLAMR